MQLFFLHDIEDALQIYSLIICLFVDKCNEIVKMLFELNPVLTSKQ